MNQASLWWETYLTILPKVLNPAFAAALADGSIAELSRRYRFEDIQTATQEERAQEPPPTGAAKP